MLSDEDRARIRANTAASPPLTPEQKARLYVLLHGGSTWNWETAKRYAVADTSPSTVEEETGE